MPIDPELPIRDIDSTAEEHLIDTLAMYAFLNEKAASISDPQTWTSDQAMSLKDWREAVRETNSGAALDVDPNLGNIQDITLTANSTFTIINPPTDGSYQRLLLILRQDATGGRTVTWPASVLWENGRAPVLQGNAGQVEVIELSTVDAGAQWLGRVVMNTLGSQTFSHTGAAQTWTVPAGVEEIELEVYGAEGGKGHASSALGGKGGSVKCRLGVTPGESLQINVGGKGTDGVGTSGSGVQAGGWNGGGSGGQGNGDTNPRASGGGGGSDVRQGGTALANRVIIAAGGGGASGLNVGSGVADSTNGSAGSSGQGGNGSGTAFSGPGGGGGGGFFGGGSGGSSRYGGTGGPFAGGDGGADIGAEGLGGMRGQGGTQSAGGAGGSADTSQGAGGGGSNYSAPRAMGAASARGVRSGHGEVRIKW